VAVDEPLQIVDSHLHLWDLGANPTWYPAMLDAGADFGLGDMSGMRRDHLAGDYRSETADWAVVKAVHVSAVSAARVHLDEGRWVDGELDRLGLPAAVIGAVEPAQTLAEIEADIAEQARSPRFRGVRVLAGLDFASATADGLLALLADGGHVFDVVVHPPQAEAFGELLARHPSATVVLEHAGWPLGTDADSRELWRRGLDRLAAYPNLSCKLSGVAMVTHSFATDALRPWVEGCLEAFGPDRCLFGSNFPVDRLFGSFDQLLDAYVELTSGLDPQERVRVFGTNAERLYRV
jgi:predicted TIM-barrel fold metal-dependent hydrolase